MAPTNRLREAHPGPSQVKDPRCNTPRRPTSFTPTARTDDTYVRRAANAGHKVDQQALFPCHEYAPDTYESAGTLNHNPTVRQSRRAQKRGLRVEDASPDPSSLEELGQGAASRPDHL